MVSAQNGWASASTGSFTTPGQDPYDTVTWEAPGRRIAN